MSRTRRHARNSRPIQPELTAEEADICQRATLAGMYQGLVDYPQLKSQERLLGIATAICPAPLQSRGADIFIGAWTGGYEAVTLQMLENKDATAMLAVIAKALPREQVFMLLLPFLKK